MLFGGKMVSLWRIPHDFLCKFEQMNDWKFHMTPIYKSNLDKNKDKAIKIVIENHFLKKKKKNTNV